MENAVNHSLVPGRDCVGDCFSTTPPPDDGSPVAVPYIAQFWPIPGWGGLEGDQVERIGASGVESLTKIYYCHPIGAPSSSRCQPGTCRSTSRSSTWETRPAPQRWWY